MTERVTLIVAALVLAGVAFSIPAAQAEEGNEAALKRQLEEVRQQLQELQLKVRRLETELGDAPAPSAAAVPAAPVPATPSAGSPPPRETAAQPGTGATPTPLSSTTPAMASPSAGSPATTAPVRVEAGISPQPAVPEAFQWRERLKDQWHAVKAGMSSQEIKDLLGTPSREFTVDGKPVWYYSYPGIGNGSVLFSPDGHTVAGWQHPPFGFW